MTSTAIISPCGAYRYVLRRNIPSVLRWIRPCLFVMLNPSTADATHDDPTIRRCLGFAQREGCTGLTVVNLFALRSTDPDALVDHADPYGPDNSTHLKEQLEAHRIGIIIAAWGAHPHAHGMTGLAAQHLISLYNPQCLGTTKQGSPRHPLYVRNDQPLIPWKLQ